MPTERETRWLVLFCFALAVGSLMVWMAIPVGSPVARFTAAAGTTIFTLCVLCLREII